jgi:hypothetical protein
VKPGIAASGDAEKFNFRLFAAADDDTRLEFNQ